MIRAALLAAAAVAAFVAPPPPSAAISPAYVATTQNVRHTLGPARAGHDLAQAQRGSDLVLAQEMGSRNARRFTIPGFSVVQLGDMQEVATYWRRSVFTHLATFPILMHRSHLFPSATRYAIVSTFSTRSAGCVIVVDLHMIPHIDRNGHPRHLPRTRLADRALDRLVAFVRASRHKCALLIGGDWNVDGLDDARVRDPRFPFAHLTRFGLRSEWTTFPHTRPTLGSRRVDGFYTAGIRTLSRRTLVGTYSDHNGDRLTFRITR